MAKLISEREVASVRLLTLEVSEDEIGTYVLCLQHLLDTSDPDTVEKITGAQHSEVAGILADLIDLINLEELAAEVDRQEEPVS